MAENNLRVIEAIDNIARSNEFWRVHLKQSYLELHEYKVVKRWMLDHLGPDGENARKKTVWWSISSEWGHVTFKDEGNAMLFYLAFA